MATSSKLQALEARGKNLVVVRDRKIVNLEEEIDRVRKFEPAAVKKKVPLLQLKIDRARKLFDDEIKKNTKAIGQEKDKLAKNEEHNRVGSPGRPSGDVTVEATRADDGPAT